MFARMDLPREATIERNPAFQPFQPFGIGTRYIMNDKSLYKITAHLLLSNLQHLLNHTTMLTRSILSSLLVASATAREITFPPISALNQYPMVAADVPGIGEDISQALYSGLTTFANLPYVHCLQKGGEVEKYDIAILGAPFDTVSLSMRGWGERG